jgi:hypothetical protein
LGVHDAKLKKISGDEFLKLSFYIAFGLLALGYKPGLLNGTPTFEKSKFENRSKHRGNSTQKKK